MPQAISQDDYLNDTSQFDYARKRAADQSATNLQSRKDALARRFASLGNLESGARIKIEDQAANEEASNLANANEGINAQQNAELGRRKEVIQGQQFQSGEAQKGRDFAGLESQKGRDFAGSQAELQRKFQTGERLGSQDFAALQSQLGRDFTTSERESLQKYQTGEREAGQQFASGEAEKQRALQKEQFAKTYGLSVDQFKAAQAQFKQTFGEEARVNDANIDFAQQALDKKGLLEGLFSGKSFGGSIGGAVDWTGILGKVGNTVSSWF